MSALVCPCRHGSHDDIFNVSERSRSEPLVHNTTVTKTAEPRRMPGKSAPGRACLRDPASLSRPPARASHALSRRARPPPGHSAGAHLPTHACSALIRVCCACRLPTLNVAAHVGTKLGGTTLAGTFLACATLPAPALAGI